MSFLQKQADVYLDCLKTRQTFLYGSVRSGKTEIQQYCAMKAIKHLTDGHPIFIGKNQGSLYRNFIVPL